MVHGILQIRQKNAEALKGTEVVLSTTPDFDGAMEEGWAKAVTSLITGVTEAAVRPRDAKKIAILPGWNLTVADLEHLREVVESFGLQPVILPDVSGALDGTVPDSWIPTTYGGTPVEDIRTLGTCVQAIAIGEHMRGPAEALTARTGVPNVVFQSLMGMKAADRFMMLLAELSGNPVPARIRRRRAQLQDALLDGHFHFGGKRIAFAAEPDQLYQLATFFHGMGAEITTAITTTGTSRILGKVPAERVQVGDLGDLEDQAAGADLIVTHSHGRQAAERLGIPLMRVGFPIFDRLGSQHKGSILYQGMRDLIFEAANLFQANQHQPTPDRLNPFLNRENDHDSGPSSITRH